MCLLSKNNSNSDHRKKGKRCLFLPIASKILALSKLQKQACVSVTRCQARAAPCSHPRWQILKLCRREVLGMGVFTASPQVTRAVEPLSALASRAQLETNTGALGEGHLCLRNQHKRGAAFPTQCPSPSSSPDRLSAAHGRWPQLAAGSVAGLPNTNKFEGRVQPGSQRFLSHFQTYYFSRASTVLLKKQGAYFASCSMVYFKLRAVFVYIQSQTSPFAINDHWHSAERGPEPCLPPLTSGKQWKSGICNVPNSESALEREGGEKKRIVPNRKV